jgi:hypothetical protein
MAYKIAPETHIIVVGQKSSGKSTFLNNQIFRFPVCSLEETAKPFRIKLVVISNLPNEIQAQLRFFKDGRKEEKAYVLPTDTEAISKLIQIACQITDHRWLDDRALFAQLELKKAPRVIVTDLPGLYRRDEKTKIKDQADYIAAKYVEAKFKTTHLLWIVSAPQVLASEIDFWHQVGLMKRWAKNPRLEITGVITQTEELSDKEFDQFLHLFNMDLARAQSDMPVLRQYDLSTTEDLTHPGRAARLSPWLIASVIQLEFFHGEPPSNQKKRALASENDLISTTNKQPRCESSSKDTTRSSLISIESNSSPVTADQLRQNPGISSAPLIYNNPYSLPMTNRTSSTDSLGPGSISSNVSSMAQPITTGALPPTNSGSSFPLILYIQGVS